MIEIIDIVTIFVFAFVIMYYVVNVRTISVILQKVYISFAVFIFCLILEIIKSFHVQHSSILKIIQKCFYFAILTYIAYTTFHDLPADKMHMLKTYLSDEVLLALFITFFIAVGKMIMSLFNLDCNKHN